MEQIVYQYTYLQVNVKQGSNYAILTLYGDSDVLSRVRSDLTDLPDAVKLTTGKELGDNSTTKITLTSTDIVNYDADLLKIAVLSTFALQYFQVLPTSMFVDLANGTEKLMIYVANPAKN